MKKMTFVICILVVISGCTSLKTPEINGAVVDAETGKPLAGVRIYAKWQKTVSGPGGQTGGAIAKELRLKTKDDGSFVIPAFTSINLVPYPFGQGGTFHMVVYAHGYKYKNFTFYESADYKNSKYDEFKSINQVIEIRLIELKNADEYWENIKKLDIKDPYFDLEDYHYFIERYPSDKNTPRAQYYIGYTYEEEIKDQQKAIMEYEKVLRDYLGTESAKSAEERLTLLKKKQK